MTLSPVFRSPDAIEALTAKGHLRSLAPSIDAQRDYRQALHALLEDIIDRRYLSSSGGETADQITFLQEHFFLTLFDSVYRALGCPPERLKVYGLLNLCLKGMVVAGDNLFDDEDKADLPLDLGPGRRFSSIMQLLCFDHLIDRVFEVHGPTLDRADVVRFRRDLLTSLASIGTLEGSEESGVDTVPTVEHMIDTVHRVRGGQLFSLAFIAPRIWERPDGSNPPSARGDTGGFDRWETARRGIASLGTAFQIVDDVTDFEFDLTRNSHNLLAAHIVHRGTPAERAAWKTLRAAPSPLTKGGPRGVQQNNAQSPATPSPLGKTGPSGLSEMHDQTPQPSHPADASPKAPTVESTFIESARAVLRVATTEAKRGFADLASVGFWYPPEDTDLFIRAIAGDAGEPRMQAVAGDLAGQL